MKASDSIKSYIKNIEGFSAKAYKDDQKATAKIEYSIGHGHQILPGEEMLMRKTITRDYAAVLFDRDIAKFEAAVNKVIKVPISQNQFDGLVSFAYNAGIGAMQKVAKTLNEKGDAVAHMNKYVYAEGKVNKTLVTRRNYESNLLKKKEPSMLQEE
jgi:lysozyme